MKHNITTYIFITLIAVCGIIFWETGFVEIILSALVLIYLSLVIYGSMTIRSNYFLKSVSNTDKRGLVLTFDDGPDPENTPRILEVLRRNDVKATFFVIGKKAENYPEMLRQMHDEGHTIANHSYSHSYFIGFFSKARLREDLVKCREAVFMAIGRQPAYFRPPFGVTNPNYAAVVKELGLQSIGWSVRSLDTQAANKYQLINRILPKLGKKDILLLHDTMKVTAESLEDVIQHCRQKGIKIESLPKMIRQEPYV